MATSGRADGFAGIFGMNQLKRESGELLAEERDGFLLLVGVDDLKSINLKQGREQGNAVLRRVADALEHAADGKRRIYRTNGDCFAVNLPDADARQAAEVFARAQRLLEGLCTLSGGCVPSGSTWCPTPRPSISTRRTPWTTPRPRERTG